MKTGVIVYVTGNSERDAQFDEKRAVRELGVKADCVDFVFSSDNDDLSYAWWRMTAKGMSRIVCMAGERIAASAVRLTGREMQLSAY